MNRGFFTSVAGLNSQLARMKNVSNNISNSGTSGYKREDTVISPFREMMLYNLRNSSGSPVPSSPREIGTINQGAQVEEVVTDFSRGMLAETGRTEDMALAGDGFFRLEDGDGNYYYTRNGRFGLDSQGNIRHSSGHYLSGEDGPVQVQDSDFSVSKSGEVTSAGENEGRIIIARFENPAELQKTGDSLFVTGEEQDEAQVENPDIRQGYIEESNVNPVKEITSAMEVMRAYGAGQKLAQAHDELNKTAIQKGGSSQ